MAAGGCNAIVKLDAESQTRVYEWVATFVNNHYATAGGSAGNLCKFTSGTAGTLLKYGGVAIVACTLGYEAIQSICKWWKGEITGVRCARTIVDGTASLAGGFAGRKAGGCLGAFGRPLGLAVGIIAGGIAGSAAASTISDRLTQKCLTSQKMLLLRMPTSS